jgi:hypothetical protein
MEPRTFRAASDLTSARVPAPSRDQSPTGARPSRGGTSFPRSACVTPVPHIGNSRGPQPRSGATTLAVGVNPRNAERETPSGVAAAQRHAGTALTREPIREGPRRVPAPAGADVAPDLGHAPITRQAPRAADTTAPRPSPGVTNTRNRAQLGASRRIMVSAHRSPPQSGRP